MCADPAFTFAEPASRLAATQRARAQRSRRPCRPDPPLARALAKVEFQLGSLFKVANPDLFAKVTKRINFQDRRNPFHWLRCNLVYDACRNAVVPQVIAVHNLARGRRIIASADRLSQQARLCIGQRLELINVKGRRGFDKASLAPELQLGLDARAMAPVVNVLLSDDDYSGYSFAPLKHPVVLGAVGGLYAAMMRWRFPLSATLTLAKFKAGEDKSVELQVFTRTQRFESKSICTVCAQGAMLTLRV